MSAYINIRYFRNKIIVNYNLQKTIERYIQATGIMFGFDLESVEEKLAKIIQKSPEKRITLTSKKESSLKLSDFSKLEDRNLKEITNFLQKIRPDITFKLQA